MKNKLRISFICCYIYIYISRVCIYILLFILFILVDLVSFLVKYLMELRASESGLGRGLNASWPWPCHQSKDTHPMTQLSVAMLALQKAPPVKETCNRSSQVFYDIL